jgi:hypothetical protein
MFRPMQSLVGWDLDPEGCYGVETNPGSAGDVRLDP